MSDTITINVAPISNGKGLTLQTQIDLIEDGKKYYAIDLIDKGDYVKQVGFMVIYPDNYGYAEGKNYPGAGNDNPEFVAEGTGGNVFPEFARLYWELSGS